MLTRIYQILYHYYFTVVSSTKDLYDKLWWRFMPGVEVKVRWPRGWVVLHEDDDGSKVSTNSADPNDHYRPWLEKHVGRQRWDWDWQLRDNDLVENQLTIKIRQAKSQYATIVGLRWS